SKMGISTYMSYTGAQIFEAVGLSKALVDKYFTGTTSSVEGISVFEVAEEAFRVRGEEHMWTPDAIAKLQHSARTNNYRTYQEYARLINDQSARHMTLRGLFEFKVDPSKSIPIQEVEPAKEIVKRFATGA